MNKIIGVGMMRMYLFLLELLWEAPDIIFWRWTTHDNIDYIWLITLANNYEFRASAAYWINIEVKSTLSLSQKIIWNHEEWKVTVYSGKL
jgi:hypothetical protein